MYTCKPSDFQAFPLCRQHGLRKAMDQPDHEFTTNYCMVYLVMFGDLIQLIYMLGCLLTEYSIFLQADHIASTIFFTLFI